jgi:hypothetical protein
LLHKSVHTCELYKAEIVCVGMRNLFWAFRKSLSLIGRYEFSPFIASQLEFFLSLTRRISTWYHRHLYFFSLVWMFKRPGTVGKSQGAKKLLYLYLFIKKTLRSSGLSRRL